MAGRLLQATVTRSLDVIRGGLGRIDTYAENNLVTIVCPAHVLHGWLQPRLDALAEALPGLCPILSIDETARYIDQLDVDLAITRQPLRQRGVVDEPLLDDELVVAAAPAVAKALAGVPRDEQPQHTSLVCLETDLTDDAIGRFIREQLGGFRKSAIYDDPRLLLDAALRGRGVALVSRLMADDALARRRLVALPGYLAHPGGPLWVSRAEGELRSPLVRGVYDSLLGLARGGVSRSPARARATTLASGPAR